MSPKINKQKTFKNGEIWINYKYKRYRIKFKNLTTKPNKIKT